MKSGLFSMSSLFAILHMLFFTGMWIIVFIQDFSPLWVPFVVLTYSSIFILLFEFRDYNKFVYFSSVLIFLVVMWGVMVVWTLDASTAVKEGYFLESGLFSFIIMGIALYMSGVYKKNVSLRNLDDILKRNPFDIVVLNNKGVELTRRRIYDKALKCFDEVLAIDPENEAALHNKSFVKKYGKGYTIVDQIYKRPNLEIIEKEGILFLKIKKGR